MSEWIELTVIGGGGNVNPASVRVYEIIAVIKTGDKSCTVICENKIHHHYSVAEAYEDVMKKIQEAETPTNPPITLYFNREEYSTILMAIQEVVGRCEEKNQPHGALDSIIGKIKELLNEEDA